MPAYRRPLRFTPAGICAILALFATTNTAEAQESIRVQATPVLVIPAPSTSRPVSSIKALRMASSQARDALDTARGRVVGWSSLPDLPDYRILLDVERPSPGSVSMGSVSGGRLTQARTLPFDGPAHSVIERHRHHGTAFGTDELVDALLAAAKSVQTVAPGAPLRLGNLSRKHGGDIRWSRSHNSGRDADIAFYVVRTDDGASIPAPDLLQFDDQGVPIGRPDLRFDVARNWLLVRGLLLQNHAGIQYLFISNGLRSMLLNYARETGEPASLVDKATDVLRQPTDSLPHDDHFHLRIICPLESRLRGCVESGPQWAWADYHQDHLLAHALEMKKALDDPNRDVRLSALDMLSVMRSPYASEIALTRGIDDADPEVRERAMRVASWAWPWSATTLVKAQEVIESGTHSLNEKAMAYSILRRSRDPMAHAYAIARVSDDDVSASEKVYAARALGHMMDERVVPFIIDQLQIQPPRVRAELASVLRRITNQSRDVAWEKLSAPGARKEAERWRAWWSAHAEHDRHTWILQGFSKSGIPVRSLDSYAIEALISSLRTSPEHVVYNVNLTLREMTGRWSPLESTDGRALHKSWAKWWKRNKARILAQANAETE